MQQGHLEKKRLLLAKAYEALPPGGALVVYEAMIDDARRVALAARARVHRLGPVRRLRRQFHVAARTTARVDPPRVAKGLERPLEPVYGEPSVTLLHGSAGCAGSWVR